MRKIIALFAVVALFATVSFAQNSGHLLINNDNVLRSTLLTSIPSALPA